MITAAASGQMDFKWNCTSRQVTGLSFMFLAHLGSQQFEAWHKTKNNINTNKPTQTIGFCLFGAVINYLFPGVESKCGDANLFDLVFTGSKQHVPMRSGWKGYLCRTRL